MTNTTNTAAIESLRSFAVSHNEIEFSHLCTCALNGEEWAVERVTEAIEQISTHGYGECGTGRATLEIVRFTDTTRPDDAIARSCLAP